MKILSITVENTGLGSIYGEEVEGIVWITESRIEITNPVDYVCDDLCGGTTSATDTEFEWSFTKRSIYASVYVFIQLEDPSSVCHIDELRKQINEYYKSKLL